MLRQNATGQPVPPHAWFVVSAIFHYLGPSFAVLLFPRVGVLGVAWFRIASAAAIFAAWSRPWRVFARADARTRLILVALGACLALMNSSFYLAIERLPLGMVAAIEFVGTILIALLGLRSARNGLALCLAIVGVFLLTDVRWAEDPLGLAFAIANGVLFMIYILLGHRIAGTGEGVRRLGAAMSAAFIFVMPLGFGQAAAALDEPGLVLAGIGVGVCSSVIPYVCDQMAMARLPRGTFALLLALLPATATVIGAVVLGQIPTPADIAGVALVMAGVAIHRAAGSEPGREP